MKLKQVTWLLGFSSSLECELCGWTFHLWSARQGRLKHQRSKVQGHGSNWPRRPTFLTVWKPHLPSNPIWPPEKSMEGKPRQVWWFRGPACSLPSSCSLFQCQLPKDFSDHLLGLAWPHLPPWASTSPSLPLPFFMTLSDTQYYTISLFVLLFIAFLSPLDCKLHEARQLCSPAFPNIQGCACHIVRHRINCWTKERCVGTKVSSTPRNNFTLSELPCLGDVT